MKTFEDAWIAIDRRGYDLLKASIDEQVSGSMQSEIFKKFILSGVNSFKIQLGNLPQDEAGEVLAQAFACIAFQRVFCAGMMLGMEMEKPE